jgi:hypothetical protein
VAFPALRDIDRFEDVAADDDVPRSADVVVDSARASPQGVERPDERTAEEHR